MFGKSKNKDQQVDLEIFTIYDSVAGNYREPTWAVNQHVIVRQFTNMMRNPQERANNQYWTNASDYSIFKIGTYDRKTGEITTQPLERVCYMHELKSMIMAELAKEGPSSALYEPTQTISKADLGIVPT